MCLYVLLSGNPCNCGTCVSVPGSYRCNCDQWTTGVHCEVDIDECKNQSLCSKQLRQGVCTNYNAVTDHRVTILCGKDTSVFAEMGSKVNLACVTGGRGKRFVLA